MLPCCAPLAILLAWRLDAFIRATPWWSSCSRPERLRIGVWAGSMAVPGVFLIAAAAAIRDPVLSLPIAAVGAVPLAGLAAATCLARRRGLAAATTAALVGAIAFHAVIGVRMLPSLEPLRLSRLLADRINAEARHGERVLLCGYEEPTVFFYVRGQARALSPADVAGALAQPGPIVLAVTDRALHPGRNQQQGSLPASVVQQLAPRVLPNPVTGFNYAKGRRETIWLARIDARQ
jgi:hypothetical protein